MFGVKVSFDMPPLECEIPIPLRELVPKKYRAKADKYIAEMEAAGCEASLTVTIASQEGKQSVVAATFLPPMMKAQFLPVITAKVSGKCSKEMSYEYAKEILVFRCDATDGALRSLRSRRSPSTLPQRLSPR